MSAVNEESGSSEDKVAKRPWAEVMDLTPSPERVIAAERRLQEPTGVIRPGVGVQITCIDYCRDRCEMEEVSDVAGFLARHRPAWSEVRWIHIAGPTDPALVRLFADKYELHPLAIEDVLHLDQRPKAEDFPFSQDHPGRLFIIARAVARRGTMS